MDTSAPRALPSGEVTFMFTDIEGSTRLVHELGNEYAEALSRHRALLRDAFAHHGGVEVVTTGDGFFAAFEDPDEALGAAVEAQRVLGLQQWPRGATIGVRIGLHTGHPTIVDGDYVGLDVHRASRIADSGHGGQIVLSDATRGLLGTTETRDLGVHRLKGLEEPEHIFQVVVAGLRSDFPPLRSLTPATNIPLALEPIVGRAREVEELHGLLTESDKRLITIHGPGGAGKTRLAAEVAIRVLNEFVDGAFFVDLTTSKADEVEMTIADALDLVSGAEASESDLATRIGSKTMLLVLDNFEQAIAAAAVVGNLLERCHQLRVLVTSQVVLRVRGEHEFPLDALGLPTDQNVDSVLRSDAARLFIRRATAARPDFEAGPHNAAAIGEICRLLDGLPLALELAAARTRLLDVDEIVARLDDRLKLLTGGARDAPARHQALRAALDWSYGLLSPTNRAFLRDFAVFEGGAYLEAIEAVIRVEGDALDCLTSLVEHSLIRRREQDGTAHFSMLQTVRAYAGELLGADPDRAGVLERHATYYLELAETLSADGGHGIDREMGNLRNALDWWLGHSDVAGAQPLRLVTALGTFWYRHGHAVEGITWFERVLAVAKDPHPELHAAALRALGVLVESTGELEQARRMFEEALEGFRASGSQKGEAASLNSLGVVMRALGDTSAAGTYFKQASELRRALGDKAGLSAATSNLGIAAMDHGDLERARSLFESALALDREIDDVWAVAVDTSNLAVVHLETDDLDRAATLSRRALQAFSGLGDKDGIAEALEVSAGVARASGTPSVAVRLAGAADALRTEAGLPLSPPDRERVEKWISEARAALSDDDFDLRWSEGAAMTTEQAVDYALREIKERGL